MERGKAMTLAPVSSISDGTSLRQDLDRREVILADHRDKR